MISRSAMSSAIACAALASPCASAIEPLPENAGWSGFLLGGVGYTELESNFVAGNTLVDIGRERIGSIAQPPRSDDAVHPVVTGELAYTFDNRWQVFFGTSLEDAVTLDGVTQLGARTDLSDAGMLQAGFLFSGIPTETWEDPYAEGVAREATDRDSTGARVQWDRVLGSAFQLTATWRDISIDRERSGEGVQSVTCDASCRSLLRRDGDFYAFDASYLFRLGEGSRHLVRPMLRYSVDDREGDAISGDGYRAQLSYVFLGRGYTFASNVAFGSASQDERNPLFGRKTDSDAFAVDATLFYRLPIASGRWQAVGSLLYGEDDSEVAFHDSEIFTVSGGVMYRFGGASR